MARKQLYAQVGVFLLLGFNVAAYWLLWPNYHGVSSNENKPAPQDKGAARLNPDAAKKSSPPKEISPASLKDAVPLNILDSLAQPGKVSPEQGALNKLFEHIQNDKNQAPPQVTLPLDRAPAPGAFDLKKPTVEEKSDAPKPLPNLPGDPLRSDNAPAQPPVGVTSALTPKVQPSPWLVSMEMIGTRTQLLAKVRQHGAGNVGAEFKILCDRIEMKSPGGELQALGSVTIVGAGLNATCNRLVLPIHETRLLFEDQARITHDGAANGVLRGDRILWELPVQAAPANPRLGLPN